MIEDISDVLLSDLGLLGRRWAELLWIGGAALLCGFVLGYERQRKSKPIGILTASLVAVGSSLFSYAGPLITEQIGLSGDATRVASMIASGIGFIGAGAIMRSEFNVTGLASAATIWCLGALGILIGTGHGLAAIAAALFLWALLRLTPGIEHRLFQGRFCLHASLLVSRDKMAEVATFLWENQLTAFETVEQDDGRVEIRLDECGLESHGGIINVLRGLEGVEELEDRR